MTPRMSRVRFGLVSAFILLLCLTDHGVQVYGRIHRSRLHRKLADAVHTVQKLEAVVALGTFESTGYLSIRDLPLEMYPNFDHYRYEGEDQARVFGRINPDGSMDPEDQAIFDEVARGVMSTGHAERFVSAFPRFRSLHRDQIRRGFTDGFTKWVGEKYDAASTALGNARDAVVNKATQFGNAVANKAGEIRDAVVNKAVEIGEGISAAYNSAKDSVKDWMDGIKRCEPSAYGTLPDGDIWGPLGSPVSGVYRVGTTYFKYDFANHSWGWSTAKEGPFRSLQNFGGSADAAGIANLIKQRNPEPFGPPDAMQALGCPDASTGSFMYHASGATPIWFKFDVAGKWSWTPYKPNSGNWMPSATHVVNGGRWNGQQPVRDNIDLIDVLEAYTSAGHVNNLPPTFGENWLVSGARDLYRATIQKVIDKVVELKNKVVELAKKLSEMKISELGANMQKLGELFAKAPLKFLGLLGLNIIVGFFNGLLYGLLGHIGHIIEHCDFATAFKTLAQKATACLKALGDLARNFHFNAIGAGFRKFFDALLDVFRALKDIITTCPKLNSMLLMLMISIAVVMAINAAAIATGYGAVVKVILIIIDLVSAAVYIVPTVGSLLNHIANLGTNLTEEKVGEEVLGAVWDVAGIAGCVTAVILTFKEMKGEMPKAKEELAGTAVGRRLGLEAKDVGEGLANASKVKDAVEAGKAGNKAAGEKAGITGTEPGPPKISEATPTVKPGQTPTVKPGQTPPVKPGQTPPVKPNQQPPLKPGQQPKPNLPALPPAPEMKLLPPPPKNPAEYQAVLPKPKVEPPIKPETDRIFVVSPDGTTVIKQITKGETSVAKAAEEATAFTKAADAPAVVAPEVAAVSATGKVSFRSRLAQAGWQKLGTLKDLFSGKIKLPESVVLPFRKMHAQFAALNNQKIWHAGLHHTEEIVLFMNQHKLAFEIYEWAHDIFGAKEGHGADPHAPGGHEAPHNDGADINALEKQAHQLGIKTDAPVVAPANHGNHGNH